MHTTLNRIRERHPCKGGWETLLKYLGKTSADDEPLSLLTVLDSNGFSNTLWCLRAVDGFEKEKLLLAITYSREVEHLMPAESKKALDVFERYANGSATEKEFEAAHAAAAWAATCAAAAARSAYAARAAAADATAARAAAKAANAAATAARAADAARAAAAADAFDAAATAAAAAAAAWAADAAAWAAANAAATAADAIAAADAVDAAATAAAAAAAASPDSIIRAKQESQLRKLLGETK